MHLVTNPLGNHVLTHHHTWSVFNMPSDIVLLVLASVLTSAYGQALEAGPMANRSRWAALESLEDALPTLPACDREGYVALFTKHHNVITHNSTSGKAWVTFGQKMGEDMQHLQLRVLLRSLRRHENMCRRDFILLLGTSLLLPRDTEDGLLADGAAGGGRTVIVRVPPIRVGVPTLDKLHAWALTNYTSLAFIDSDVMAVAPLDLFDERNTRGLLIARHPYDAVQAKCGLPLERRGVSALFLMHPSTLLFEQLLTSTRKNNSWWDVEQTRHTPEQMGLACYFHEHRSLATLPCRYLYDLANSHHVAGGSHHRGCLRRGAARWSSAGNAHCAAVAERMASECLWEGHAHDVRAVHFKGSMKPWTKVLPKCKRLKHGRLLKLPLNNSAVGPPPDARARKAGVALRPTEELEWDERVVACVTQQNRQPVAWARYDSTPRARLRLVPRACCSYTVALKAEWHALRPPTKQLERS